LVVAVNKIMLHCVIMM